MALTPDQIAHSLEVLLEKRAVLVDRVERLNKDACESTLATENSKAPMNSAENASDTYEQEFAFLSMESEEDLLRAIDAALQRIRDHAYGECAECGGAINPERLEALPWATLCVKCQELEERGLRRKKEDVVFEIADEAEEALIGDDKEQA